MVDGLADQRLLAKLVPTSPGMSPRGRHIARGQHRALKPGMGLTRAAIVVAVAAGMKLHADLKLTAGG